MRFAMPKKDSDWPDNLMEDIKRHIALKRYRFTKHVLDRLKHRSFELLDVVYVLNNGYHEREKTVFNNKLQMWNYAIRGKTLDGTDTRVVIAFEKNMIIVTVIRLSKRKK
jgi:hypothetical protein